MWTYAVAAGVLAVAATAAVLLRARRPAPSPAGRRTPPDAAGVLPGPGDAVRVHTHFGDRGGYVDHQGLLLWGEGRPAGDFTPGTLCTVAEVHTDGDAVGLTVVVAR